MQDSNLKYYILVEGAEKGAAAFKLVGDAAKQAATAVNATSNAAGKGSQSIKQLGAATDGAGKSTERASKAQASYFSHIAKTTVQSALINKLFLELVDVSGQAVKQVDLMQNFPATMASMGQSTADASVAMQTLSKYVGQMGGDLGTAVSTVTRFTGVTKSVKAATAVYAGLNNALIAGDSSMEEQRLSLIQFAQAFERGKPDMREWLSLTQNMSFQLSLVAKEMGFVNATALGESLRAGETSMASFTAKLTEMSTGTGPIAQQAIARMQGMQFAFNVLKNTMVQGLASIINAFGRSNIVAFFGFLTQVVATLASWVVVAINAFVSLFNIISRFFGGPQIGKVVGETAAIASNIGAGAGAAGDLGDGLDGAGASAKKLNKQLASFDKMNVLADKETGGGGGGGGGGDDAGAGGGGFDPSAISGLEGLLDGIGGKLQEASIWAKIFAGVLAGLVGIKFAQGILNQLNGMIKTIDETRKNLKRLKDAFKGVEKEGEKVGKSLGEKIASGVGKSSSAITSVIAGFVGGIATALGPVIVAGISAIGAFLAGLGVVTIGIIILVVAAIVGAIYLIWTNWQTIWGWITTAFSTFWGWITSLWNTLYDIFKGPIEWLWQFVSAIFLLIIAIVATFVEGVFNLFVGLFKLIYALVVGVPLWIYNNLILPIYNFFVSLWQGVVDVAKAAWDFLLNQILLPVVSWISDNIISPVVNLFRGLWSAVSGFVSGFVNKVKDVLSPLTSWIKVNIIDRIAGFFTGLWEGVKNGLANMIDGLRSLFGGIGQVFKVPINGIITLINKALLGMNKIKVPDWVPLVGGKGINFPTIPLLAKGGVVSQATMAMIGENGAEAVVPLENNLEWLDVLASKINGTGNGQPIQLTVQIGEDKIVSKVIELINEKTQMSGRNAILV